jgi:LysM repeat protein
MFAKAVFLAALAVLVLSYLVHTSSGSGPKRIYVVKPADTLWSIAVRYYDGDPREGIWKLERRNHLASALVQPGARLVLP